MQLHAFHPLSYSMGGAVQRFTVNSKFFQLLRHPLMQKYFSIVMIAKPSDWKAINAFACKVLELSVAILRI